jgi:hypothetical protein
MDFVLYYSDTTEYNGRFEQSGFELASSGELMGNNVSWFVPSGSMARKQCFLL